jgi:multidrug efflux pump subunit AcrA (membrane-fusion protein)
LSGRNFVGKLTSIDNAIDPVTLAVKVRATLPNEGGLLKSGTSMSVDAGVPAAHVAFGIPEIAVIAEGSKNFVYRDRPVEATGHRGEDRGYPRHPRTRARSKCSPVLSPATWSSPTAC